MTIGAYLSFNATIEIINSMYRNDDKFKLSGFKRCALHCSRNHLFCRICCRICYKKKTMKFMNETFNEGTKIIYKDFNIRNILDHINPDVYTLEEKKLEDE